MTGHDMTDISVKLSAYLDGELSDPERAEIEELLATDQNVQDEFDALLEAQSLADAQFGEAAEAPVSLELVKMIKDADLSAGTPVAPANSTALPPSPRPIWGLMAASLVALTVGGAGGFLVSRTSAPQNETWLAEIAQYHAVYAQQQRHLVEVKADEADHIQNWLGNTVGTAFSIPDLSAFELTFEGGRLLVANGKPVAQLMYRAASGDVIALCFQTGETQETTAAFTQTQNSDFDMLSWSNKGADYVVIGPKSYPQLEEVAKAAAISI